MYYWIRLLVMINMIIRKCRLHLQKLKPLEMQIILFLNIRLGYHHLGLTPSYWKYLQHQEIVFDHQKLAKFKMKPSKWQFFKQYIHYLGHLISKQGIQPLHLKVKMVKNLKKPNSMNEVCHFLGLTGYYRRITSKIAS